MLSILLKHQSGDIIFEKESNRLVINSIDFNEIRLNSGIMELNGVKGRAIFIENPPFQLYIFSDSKDHIKQSQEVFLECMNIYILMLSRLLNVYEKNQKEVENSFQRFTHNIKEANTRNIQRLEELVETSIADKKFREKLSSVIKSEQGQNKIQKALLNFKKDSDDIKNEMKVFKLLNSSQPIDELSFLPMSIHSVILGLENVYYFEFLSIDIVIKLGEMYKHISIDYPSVSVIIRHIFDNALKYCKRGSNFLINFFENENEVIVDFQMISLELIDGEISKIFNEGYSGVNAIKKELNGKGIGMFIANEIAKINRIKMEFIPGEFDSCDSKNSSIRYTENTIRLTFPIN